MSYLFFPLVMQLFPALIYRINRYNSQDKIILQHFLNQTSASFPYNRPGYSMLVSLFETTAKQKTVKIISNIFKIALSNDLSELWSQQDQNDIQLSCEYVKGMSENTFMAMQIMSEVYCPIQRTGVLGYSTDRYYKKYPILKTEIPVLVLHGM